MKYGFLAQITRLRNIYAANGFDLFIPFNVKTYNDRIDPKYKLPSFGKKDGNCQAILVGNTGRIWPYFVDAVKCNPELLDIQHPFDTWVRAVIDTGVNSKQQELGEHELSAFVNCFKDYSADVCNADAATQTSVHFSFDCTPGKMVAMQHQCHSIGFGFYDQSSYVVSHPVLGPWFALRAVIVLDCDVLLPSVESSVVYPLYGSSMVEREKLVNMPLSPLDLGFTSSELNSNNASNAFVNHYGIPTHPCTAGGCLELHHTALQGALAKQPYKPTKFEEPQVYAETTPYLHAFPAKAPCEDTPARWESSGLSFLPVRSTCRIGCGWRYTEEQNLFHYAHDRITISECLSRLELKTDK